MMCLHFLDGPNADPADRSAGPTVARRGPRARPFAREIIRRYVEKGLSEEAPERAVLYERAARVVGRFRDRGRARDVSKNHDRYLDEAFE